MKQVVSIGSLKPGEQFEAWGHKYAVLGEKDGGVFVVEVDAAARMPFRESYEDFEVAPNDYRDSTINRYLNTTYINKLEKAGAVINEDILEMEMDLKCSLGRHEYGTYKTKVGILTLEQYGKYYDRIPRIEVPYWLATPYATPLRSPDAYSTGYVFCVGSSGDWNGWNYDVSLGVRPALVLNSSLLVSKEG